MLEIAGLAIAGVAALGTLVQAYYSAKANNKSISKTKIDKAEERASEPLKTGVKKVAEVIDSGLLETLQNEIESQNRRLIIAFRSSEIDDVERARMVEEARKKICKFLREVMRFNEGNLPTKRLEMLWSSNSCDK